MDRTWGEGSSWSGKVEEGPKWLRHVEELAGSGLAAPMQNSSLSTSSLFQAFLIGSQGTTGKKCIRISNFAVWSIFLFIQENQSSGWWKSGVRKPWCGEGKWVGQGDTQKGQTSHYWQRRNKGEKKEERCQSSPQRARKAGIIQREFIRPPQWIYPNTITITWYLACRTPGINMDGWLCVAYISPAYYMDII